MRRMPGEVSTRAGGQWARLTSLPRRQAAAARQCSGADGDLAGHRGSGRTALGGRAANELCEGE
jgi:hypothetical protein